MAGGKKKVIKNLIERERRLKNALIGSFSPISRLFILYPSSNYISFFSFALPIFFLLFWLDLAFNHRLHIPTTTFFYDSR